MRFVKWIIDVLKINKWLECFKSTLDFLHRYKLSFAWMVILVFIFWFFYLTSTENKIVSEKFELILVTFASIITFIVGTLSNEKNLRTQSNLAERLEHKKIKIAKLEELTKDLGVWKNKFQINVINPTFVRVGSENFSKGYIVEDIYSVESTNVPALVILNFPELSPLLNNLHRAERKIIFSFIKIKFRYEVFQGKDANKMREFHEYAEDILQKYDSSFKEAYGAMTQKISEISAELNKH